MIHESLGSHLAPDCAPRDAARSELASRPFRVLLAEDDHPMRAMIAAMLVRRGFAVVEVRNGAELLGVLADAMLGLAGRTPIDIVVSDLRMPGMTGLTILRWLRRAGWRTPFVLMTAFPTRETVDAALAAGADAVFDKPLPLARLLETVTRLSARGRK